MAGLILLPATASAEFRYIAPSAARAGVTVLDEAGQRNEETSAQTLQLPPGAAELTGGDRGHNVWRVDTGDTLRDVLERWGARAGIEVLFLTDRRYRLHRGQVFEGEFIDAVRTLFFALSHMPHPPTGELAPGGRSLAVTHRAPQSAPTGDKP